MTTTQTDLATLDQELNDTILEGRILDAFEQYYADDVVMQENADTPTHGKDANRTREEEFVDSIEAFHGAELLATAVGDDLSFGEWMMDVTLKGVGRVKLEQVSVRRWRHGLVAEERFYYNKG